MKKIIIIFIYLYCHHTLSKERENKVSIENDNGIFKVNAFYDEDKDTEVELSGNNGQISVQTDELYSSQIHISPKGNGSFEVSYFGPLYAQCGPSRCEAQGYSFTIDKCGKVSDLGNERTGLKRYAPKNKEGNFHTNLTKSVLDRIQFYGNSNDIMKLFYEDLAGKDRKSNYVLGNTATPKTYTTTARNSTKERDDIYSGSGSRWLLNPWSTNTVATFLIHLDIAREALKSIEPSGCNNWPRFKGQTPLPRDKVDPYGIPFPDNYIGAAIYEIELLKSRINNEKIEFEINKIADRCSNLDRVGNQMLSAFSSDQVFSNIEAVLNSLDSSLLPDNLISIDSIKKDLNDYDKTTVLNFYGGLVAKLKKLKEAQELKNTYYEVWKDGVISKKEVNDLFQKFKNYNGLDWLPIFNPDTSKSLNLKTFLSRKIDDIERLENTPDYLKKDYRDRFKKIKDDWFKFLQI